MIMTEEFKKGIHYPCPPTEDDCSIVPGSEIVEKVILGQAQWSELFTKHDFFHKYRYYLKVIASTGSSDLQIKWCYRLNRFEGLVS